jgi:hypothetical protein
MSLHRFPLKTAQTIRQYIRQSLTPPDTGTPLADQALEQDVPPPDSVDSLGDLFERGGFTNTTEMARAKSWVVSTVNPASALIKLPGLQLKSGVRLVSYLYRSQAGAGIVWAVPEAMATTAQLEAAIQPCSSIAHVPKPMHVISPLMEAIEGDRSPISFLAASLFRREVQEFGAMGDRRSWSHHRLLDAIPTDSHWQWSSQPPKDLLPKVKITADGQGIVEFFSCRLVTPYTLYRHIDQYRLDTYDAKSLAQAIGRKGSEASL